MTNTLYIGNGKTLTAFANVELIDDSTFDALLNEDRRRFTGLIDKYAALDQNIADARKSHAREHADELTPEEAEAGIARSIFHLESCVVPNGIA